MAKGREHLTKSRGRDSRGTRIAVDVKLNILHTIADAIYATSAGKVREAVANSRDNDATWVLIALDQTNRRMSIMDNGCGITRERFKKIFDSIGYGLLQGTNGPKLSYFGLGLMSIFQLGNRVKLYTRPRDNPEILSLEIDTGAIFDRANKGKSITQLSTFINPLKPATETERRKASIETINEALQSGTPSAMPASFTEIIIEDISQDDVEEMGSADFRVELTQLLPLRPRDSGKDTEPFLGRFIGTKRETLVELLKNADYCKAVDAYFAVQEEAEEVTAMPQLWKYFPRFNSSITFRDDNVYIGKSDDGAFAYYVVHTIGEDLQRDQGEGERETGFWIRNQNFLARRADFLDKPGPGRKPAGTIDKPLRNWVFGEVFHRDMNAFLTVGRNEFLYEGPGFKKFRNAFLEKVASPVNKAIRAVWEKRKPIIDNFVTPFAKVAEPDGPIARAQGRLRLMIGKKKSDRQFFDEARALLAGRRVQAIEDNAARVDVILSKRSQPLILWEDVDAVVRVVPTPAKGSGTHEVKWDARSQKVVVDVSPSLFAPRPVLFLGESFEVVFVAKKDSEPGVSIDSDKKRIYVNPFNGDLSQFSISILDVYIALEVADAVSKTKTELKRNCLRLLGAAPSDAAKFVTPLGDDLRRSAIYRG
jgi:hypothetical protein